MITHVRAHLEQFESLEVLAKADVTNFRQMAPGGGQERLGKINSLNNQKG